MNNIYKFIYQDDKKTIVQTEIIGYIKAVKFEKALQRTKTVYQVILNP